MTNFLNCAQGGSGGFSWYKTSSTTIPTKLMNLDNNKNISDLNDVSCATVTTTGNVSCASVSATGNVSCATISTTGNVNIASTTSSTSQTSGALTVAGGVGIVGTLNVLGDSNFTNNLSCGSFSTAGNFYTQSFNNMSNYTVRGYSYKSGGVVYHTWSASNGTSNTNNNFSFVLPTNCIAMQSLYCYYTSGTNTYQGITPYYYMQSTSTMWNQNIGSTIGNASVAQPSTTTINGTGPFYYYVVLNTPTNNTDYIYFTFNIWMY
jgi:hypothetical protein